VSEIKFSKEEKSEIIDKVQTYFSKELDQEIERFDAEFLIDFFAEEIGAYFYNRGLNDAQILLNDKIEELCYLVQDLEKPTDYTK